MKKGGGAICGGIGYKQVKGTAMTVDYANIFLDKFEKEIPDEYEKSTNVKSLSWMRYMEDIFFIWHHDETPLKKIY